LKPLGFNIELLMIDGFILLSISQETEAKKRKLQMVRQKKLTLMAEVRYSTHYRAFKCF
jgi:hypothetical protein